MTKTSNFNANTDYVILASDGSDIINLSIPAGSTVPPQTNRFFESRKSIGNDAGSPIRSIFQINGSSENIIATEMFVEVSVTYASITTNFLLRVSVERLSGTEIRVYAMLSNNTNSTLTINTATDILARIRTFKSPFEN